MVVKVDQYLEMEVETVLHMVDLEVVVVEEMVVVVVVVIVVGKVEAIHHILVEKVVGHIALLQ